MLSRVSAAFVLTSLASLIVHCGPRPQAVPTSRPSPTPAAKIVDFVPGIRIDYRAPQVEVDSEIVLRKGALELFAYCRAQVPKEHETILRTEASCERVYQALGLIGLTPGRPMRYDVETKKVELPEGDPVDVIVRYEVEGKTREHSACDWMLDASTKKPMTRTHWLFTGSRREVDGQFAANIEGTLVTVVDFPTSLLGLPASHSESDTQLWLMANTEAIPPIGTPVTLLLRPAARTSTDTPGD